MPELTAILVAKRKSEHDTRKFLAAIQGIDMGDSDTDESKKQVTFEDIKARVFSGGQAKDANDILSMQGINASQSGFGIGMGLDYVNAKESEEVVSW